MSGRQCQTMSQPGVIDRWSILLGPAFRDTCRRETSHSSPMTSFRLHLLRRTSSLQPRLHRICRPQRRQTKDRRHLSLSKQVRDSSSLRMPKMHGCRRLDHPSIHCCRDAHQIRLHLSHVAPATRRDRVGHDSSCEITESSSLRLLAWECLQLLWLCSSPERTKDLHFSQSSPSMVGHPTGRWTTVPVKSLGGLARCVRSPRSGSM